MKVILRKGIPPEKTATATQPPVVSLYVIFYLYDISCTYPRPTHNYLRTLSVEIESIHVS